MNDILGSSKEINVKKQMNKKSNKERIFVNFTMKKFSRKHAENFNKNVKKK